MTTLQAPRLGGVLLALLAGLGGCSSGRGPDTEVRAAVAGSAVPAAQAESLAPSVAARPNDGPRAPAEAAPAAWLPQPGAGFFMAAYEDSAPQPGDYDLNDLVVAYRYQLGFNASGLVERIEGQAYIVARGSGASHDWTLDLRLPPGAAATAACTTVTPSAQPLPCAITAGNGRVRWTAFRDTRTAFPAVGGAEQPVNTAPGSAFARGPKATFTLRFDPAVSLHTVGAGQPWLKVLATGRELHVDDRSADGLPLALLVPTAWQPPLEHVHMTQAYPQLQRFVATSGLDDEDWWRRPLAGRTRPVSSADWVW